MNSIIIYETSKFWQHRYLIWYLLLTLVLFVSASYFRGQIDSLSSLVGYLGLCFVLAVYFVAAYWSERNIVNKIYFDQTVKELLVINAVFQRFEVSISDIYSIRELDAKDKLNKLGSREWVIEARGNLRFSILPASKGFEELSNLLQNTN
ncbi:hypothetical protein QWZ13_09635 [Reinekea marina]|uniref:PH domain-containing protein n=1 Tax=Reinekea marina TaxID=1310421 RepID=A0ABV7WW57_9GAMM|nr:hypothetical protein [Reinekea marina]MBU2862896.1 hypothetical protein [Reinekea forsetii]MDN3649171.1 hypothetical protein [Reinekea marina]